MQLASAAKFGEAKPQTLGDIVQSTDSAAQSYIVLLGENLGSPTLKMSLPIRKFIDISEVANRNTINENESYKSEYVAQRNLVREHAVGLAKYTLMGLVQAQINDMERSGETIPQEVYNIRDELGNPPYASLQPIVANIRACLPKGTDIKATAIDGGEAIFRVTLTSRQMLWVVDGQHRREGFQIVMEFLQHINRTFRYQKRGLFRPAEYQDDLISESIYNFWQRILEIALTRSSVAVEIHLGLTKEEEQQLFFDLNSKGRKVQTSLAYSFDHADPINVYIKENLVDSGFLPFELSETDQVDWHGESASLSRKDVTQVCSLLFVGKGTTKTATPALVKEREEFATTFWQTILSIPGFGRPGAKKLTIAAQVVVLKALAKLAHDLAWGHSNIQSHNELRGLYDAIKTGKIDFSHQNNLWQALLQDNETRARNFPGIDKYVHVPSGTNLDAGTYDAENQWVRFGSRHNDIYPRLGDLIRYAIRLDPRPSVTRTISKEAQSNPGQEQ